jgi:hypothetical protein
MLLRPVSYKLLRKLLKFWLYHYWIEYILETHMHIFLILSACVFFCLVYKYISSFQYKLVV